MDQNERIEQFRKMAQANPDDDLAHFALGQALGDAGRFAEAVPVLRHVVKLNDTYSRAYLLLGEALEHTTDDEGAVEAWQDGYSAALRRGDLMVANEMKAKLVQREAEVPEDPTIAAGGAEEIEDRDPEEGEVRDARTGRVGAALEFAPFPDAVGEWIQAHISQESWEAWMEMSIKVINELRLDLGDPEHQAAYDQHMQAFLNVPADTFAARDA